MHIGPHLNEASALTVDCHASLWIHSHPERKEKKKTNSNTANASLIHYQYHQQYLLILTNMLGSNQYVEWQHQVQTAAVTGSQLLSGSHCLSRSHCTDCHGSSRNVCCCVCWDDSTLTEQHIHAQTHSPCYQGCPNTLHNVTPVKFSTGSKNVAVFMHVQ